MHATEAPPTASLPPSTKFWCSLMVSNLSSKICMVFFCPALTQIVLMCKVSSTGYKGHLQLKHSTAEQHIKTNLLFPVYSLQATELIYGDITTIQLQSTSA